MPGNITHIIQPVFYQSVPFCIVNKTGTKAVLRLRNIGTSEPEYPLPTET